MQVGKPQRAKYEVIPIATLTNFINQVNDIYRWQLMEEAIVRLNPERSKKIIEFRELMRGR